MYGARNTVVMEGNSIDVIIMDHSRSMAQQLMRSLLTNLPKIKEKDSKVSELSDLFLNQYDQICNIYNQFRIHII